MALMSRAVNVGAALVTVADAADVANVRRNSTATVLYDLLFTDIAF